jgi:hypothetical protein
MLTAFNTIWALYGTRWVQYKDFCLKGHKWSQGQNGYFNPLINRQRSKNIVGMVSKKRNLIKVGDRKENMPKNTTPPLY